MLVTENDGRNHSRYSHTGATDHKKRCLIKQLIAHARTKNYTFGTMACLKIPADVQAFTFSPSKREYKSFISFPFSKCDQLDVSRLVSTLIISFSHPSNFSNLNLDDLNPISICSESSLKVRMMTWIPNHVNIYIEKRQFMAENIIYFFLSLTFSHSVNARNRSPAHVNYRTGLAQGRPS